MDRVRELAIPKKSESLQPVLWIAEVRPPLIQLIRREDRSKVGRGEDFERHDTRPIRREQGAEVPVG